MSWVVVARKDFHDAIRSRMFLALALLFGLFSVGLAGLFGYYTDELLSALPTEDVSLGLITFVSNPVALFVTLVGVIICHKSIVGERESGSLRILLSLPHTRGDIILGKIVGRSAVLLVPAIASLLLGVVIGSLMTGAVPTVSAVILILGIVLLSVTYVSVIVGLSAMTGSEGVATAAAVGYYIVFEIMWAPMSGFVPSLLFNSNPDWMYIIRRIPPSSAFGEVLNATLVAATDYPSEIVGARSIDAFYGTPLTALVILLIWLFVPAYIGYRRFDAADL